MNDIQMRRIPHLITDQMLMKMWMHGITLCVYTDCEYIRGRIAQYLLWEELIFLPIIGRPYASHSIGLEIIFLQHLAK